MPPAMPIMQFIAIIFIGFMAIIIGFIMPIIGFIIIMFIIGFIVIGFAAGFDFSSAPLDVEGA